MYVTIYTQSIRRRKTGRVETIGRAYATKALTAHHAALRQMFPDAETWMDPKRVITDFVPGMNLGTKPLVKGGQRVA